MTRLGGSATGCSRRTFVQGVALASVAPLKRRLPRWSANEGLNVACVGVGGMGRSDLGSVAKGEGVRIVALCDVDAARLGAAAEAFAGARQFADFRRMLDELGSDVDAVVVSTPDHMHGPIALAAMERGKHVYVQKPIAQSLAECRAMADAASAGGLVTQMGTQIHSHEAYRTAVATLRTGVIGRVVEAHLWVGKSWAGPPEGRPDREDPVPEGLAWDLWLGVAPARPFVAGIYHPARWRGWLDFGAGTLGDMGCHIFDPVFTALGIGAPQSVVSRGPAHGVETYAADSDIVWECAGGEATASTVTLRWTDGAAKPDVAKAQLPADAKLPGSGSFVVGERGVMVLPHWAMPSFYRDGERLEVELELREARDHYGEWTSACRGEGTTSTPFSYAGPLTEAVLVGCVAGRFRGRELAWDSAALRFDDEEANAFVSRDYREGWSR